MIPIYSTTVPYDTFINAIVFTTETHPIPNMQEINQSLQQSQMLCSMIDRVPVKNILVILKSTEPQMASILIDGSSGIGKTVLCKETTFEYAPVAIYDHKVRQTTLVSHLLKLFCRGDERAIEITDPCDFLFKTGRKEVVFLLDGYDCAELPAKLQKDSLIDDQVLSNCGLIAVFCPCDIINLQWQAIPRIDIVGFSKADWFDEDQTCFTEQLLCHKESLNCWKAHYPPQISIDQKV